MTCSRSDAATTTNRLIGTPGKATGGVRIPFARANTAYAEQSNQQMMEAALRGVVLTQMRYGQMTFYGRGAPVNMACITSRPSCSALTYASTCNGSPCRSSVLPPRLT